MARNSLTEYLEASSRWHHDVAIVWRRAYRTHRWTYALLKSNAAHYDRLLEKHGVQPRDRVFLWGANSGEWIAAFWAVLARGAVAVPMDQSATPEFARTVARQVSPRLLVVDAAFRETFRNAEFESKLIEWEQISSGDSNSSIPPGQRPIAKHADIKRTDVAEIIFTSGSTAEPKGVVLTHGNLLANLEPLEAEIAKYRKYERWVHPLRFLEMLPLSHVFGQFMGIFVPQLLGATVVFSDTLNPSELIRTARRERVNVLVAVPRVLESVRNKLQQQERERHGDEAFQRDLAAATQERFWWRWWRFRRIHRQLGWRFWAVISGGATLSRELEQFWSALGYAVIQGYGLTETASLVTLRHPFKKGAGSIGQSLPGREMKVDESGEIMVRGENVAAGYWGSEHLQSIAGDGGWFRTGDLGEVDREGNVYFKGRRKNVLVTAAGMNVYPEDIEAALRAQPEIRDCSVVVIQVEGREVPGAALVMQWTGLNVARAVENANRQMAEYQRVHHWIEWPHGDLPRTATGKPRLSAIREALQAHFAAGGTHFEAKGVASGSASPLGEILLRLCKTAGVPSSQIASLASSTSLEADLKLTSIDRVELLSEIEDRFQMDVNEGAFANARTVGEVEALLRQPGEAGSPYPYASWPRNWLVAVLREVAWWTLVIPAMLLLGWPRKSGREELRKLSPPFLLVANHQTEIDAAFVLAALPGRLRRRMSIAMVGERLRNMRHPPAGSPWLHRIFHPLGYGLLVAFFHVFPLPKQSGVRGSFEFMGELVEQGWAIMIFPEGQLSRDGAVAPFRSGIGVLAQSLDVPVVPARLFGLYELRQAGRRYAPPGQIEVRFGEPLRFGNRETPESIAEKLREAVARLK